MIVAETLDCVKSAVQALTNKKGIKIVAIDLRDVSSITDFVIIAEGGANRHVAALAKEVMGDLKEHFSLSPVYEEGLSTGEWVALDYSDFMVHILTSDLRNYYRIESIWPEAKILELDIKE
jgi:ribosome-associated protein